MILGANELLQKYCLYYFMYYYVYHLLNFYYMLVKCNQIKDILLLLKIVQKVVYKCVTCDSPPKNKANFIC